MIVYKCKGFILQSLQQCKWKQQFTLCAAKALNMNTLCTIGKEPKTVSLWIASLIKLITEATENFLITADNTSEIY